MTIEEAKSIRIADYLHSLGYSPVKQQGINLWYKSPFREESEASFKVNTEREQWYDFGLGKGGNIIALAAHLYATDHVPYILKRIAEQTPHVRPVSFSFGKPIIMRIRWLFQNILLLLYCKYQYSEYNINI